MSSRSRCGLRDMTNREPTATTNLDKTSEAEPLPWKGARDLLDAGALAEAASFLGTVRPDGRPHSARIGAAWYDGNVYFQTGQQTRKVRNLAVNPACTLSRGWPSGSPTARRSRQSPPSGGRAAGRLRSAGTGSSRPTTRPAPGRRRGRCIAWPPTPCSASRRQSRTARHAGSSEPQTVTPATNVTEDTEMSEAIQFPETRPKAAEQLADRYMALWNEPDADRAGG